MKIHLLSSLVLTLTLALTASAAEKTANEILATPEKYEGKPVPLEVAFLRPARWKSPFEDTGFAFAMTADSRGKEHGGEILIAFPEIEREALMKKYGVTRDLRGKKLSTKTLKGTLTSSSEDGQKGVWFIDLTEGKILEELAKKNEQFRNLVNSGRR